MAVAKALHAEFSLPVRADATPQNVVAPCFFVTTVSVEQNDLIDNRAVRNVSLDVTFISDEGASSLAKTSTTLFECLRFVDGVDSKYLGRSMNSEVIDGDLHFFVEYSSIVKRIVDPHEKMGDISISTRRG